MDELLPGMASAPLHPMFVHFPIALWFAAVPVWIYAVVKKNDGVWRSGRLMFELGTLGAIAAATTGLIAANAMGHDAAGHDVVHTHRNLMLTAGGLALSIVALERLWTAPRARWVATGLAVVLAVIVTFGADLGAHLVYGKGVGVNVMGEAHDSGEHGSDEHAH